MLVQGPGSGTSELPPSSPRRGGAPPALNAATPGGFLTSKSGFLGPPILSKIVNQPSGDILWEIPLVIN